MEKIKITTLNSDRLELLKPIPVATQILPDGHHFIFVMENLEKELHYHWGEGKTKEDAIKDFCEDLEYLYFTLKDAKLAKGMQRVWDYMQIVIREK